MCRPAAIVTSTLTEAVEHTTEPWVGAAGAHAVHDVGAGVDARGHEACDVGAVELAVAVDVHEQVGPEFEAGAIGGERGRSVAAVLLGGDDVHAGQFGRELGEHLGSGIRRSIVDDDDVEPFGERSEVGVQFAHEAGDAGGFVVRRHDHGEVIQAHAVSQAADVQGLHESG